MWGVGREAVGIKLGFILLTVLSSKCVGVGREAVGIKLGFILTTEGVGREKKKKNCPLVIVVRWWKLSSRHVVQNVYVNCRD